MIFGNSNNSQFYAMEMLVFSFSFTLHNVCISGVVICLTTRK